MPKVISILLVDDHAMVREGLADQIRRDPALTVVACVGDAHSAVEMVEQLTPDIVLMDVHLPGLSCFAAARIIAERWPKTRVVFLSAFGHDRYIDQALAAQAWGYLTKTESSAAVREAIHAVAAGRVHFSQDIKTRLVADRHHFRLSRPSHSRVSTLTARELEIFRYLAEGRALKDVARLLGLSAKTVDNHKSNIMAKLDIHDRVALARFAVREGISEA